MGDDVADEFGSLGFDASGDVGDGELEGVGYPGNPRPLRNQGDPETFPFHGKKMWRSVGDHTGTDGDVHAMENAMTGGCSGGPWLQEGSHIAVGLNSSIRVPHDNRMFSPVFDHDFLLLIRWLVNQDAF